MADCQHRFSPEKSARREFELIRLLEPTKAPAPSRCGGYKYGQAKAVCEKQGLYDRPDGFRRQFPGQHWPNSGAEALAVAEAGPLAGAKIYFQVGYY